MNATPIQIALELEPDGDSLSGRATGADGTTREFSGWIGLMGLVDSLIDAARSGLAKTNTEEKHDAD